MRVRMLRLMCHPEYGNVDAGQEVDLPDDEAKRRIAARYCVPVDEPKRGLVDKIRRRGRGDGGQDPKKEKETPDADPATKPIDKMTVPELQAYAAEHEIDLGEASLKRDILAAIETAQDSDE